MGTRSARAAAVDAVAAEQHGLVHRQQLLDLGLSASAVHRWSTSGHLRRLAPGVYALPGAPETWHQRLLAAVLAAGHGSVASHLAAAALWGLDGAPPGRVEVLSPRWLRRHSVPAIVHETRVLPDRDRSERAGIPVTGIERTLVDAGAVAGELSLERLVDDAVRRRLTTYGRVERRLEGLSQPSRPGLARVRAVLERRRGSVAPPESPLEARVVRVLVEGGLPAPRRQVVARTPAGRFRLDLAWPEHRVALECDGFAWHSSPEQLAEDHRRQNALVVAGWVVLLTSHVEVLERPEQLVATVRRALLGGGWRPAA